MKLTQSFIVIFIKTIFYFFKNYTFKLILLFLIASQSNVLIADIFQYIQTGEFANTFAFSVNVLTIFIEIIILIWLLTEYRFLQTLDSVAVTNIWFIFTLAVSMLISSWFLWVLSQFISELAFWQIGDFTKYGSIILVLFIIVLFFVTYIIQRRREA